MLRALFTQIKDHVSVPGLRGPVLACLDLECFIVCYSPPIDITISSSSHLHRDLLAYETPAARQSKHPLLLMNVLIPHGHSVYAWVRLAYSPMSALELAFAVIASVNQMRIRT